MHEDEVRDMLDKIQQADRTIQQQQLGIKWNPPEDPFQQNYTKDQTKDGIEEKIMQKDKSDFTLIEKLTEKESETFKKNLSKLLDLLEKEARWLLDEETQHETNDLKRYSAVLRVLKVTTNDAMQKILLVFQIKGRADLSRNVFKLDLTSEQVISNLSKWLEQADEDNSHKDWETSSQDTSKKSATNKSSHRDRKGGRNREITDDPRTNREN